MADVHDKFITIKTREAAAYANDGYFVIQNTSPANIGVSESGIVIKNGMTMAIGVWDSVAERALQRGLISMLAKPLDRSETESKKAKKKPAEPEISQESVNALVEDSPAVTLVEPEPEPEPEPVIEDNLPEPAVEEVNTSENKVDEIDDQSSPF